MDRSRRLVLWCLFALVATACSESVETSSGEGRGRQWISMRVDGQGYEAPLRDVHRLLPVPPNLGDWEVEGPSSLIDAFPGESTSASRKTLGLTGRQEKRFRVRGPFERRAFNRVNLRALVRGAGAIRLQPRLAGADVGPALTLELEPDIDAQDLSFDWPEDYLDEVTEIDALAFRIDGEVGPVGIRQLELVKVLLDAPKAIATAREVGSLGPVTQGEGTRTAYELSNGQSLSARFEGVSGQQLRFALGQDSTALASGAAQEVTVRWRLTAEARGWSREGEVPLGEAWRLIQVELGELKGAECELRIEVLDSGGPAGFALVERPQLVRPEAQPPTVLLLTSDTHRGDHLSKAVGAPTLRTPTLDALMERGISFDRAFSSSNITLPSHTSLLTGRHPRDTGVISNTQGLNASAPTLAEAFAEAGWGTIASVSARHLFEWGGTSQGFERYSAPLKTQRGGARSLASLLEDMQDFEDRPLFLWLHLYDPHRPYDAPDDHGRAYLDELDPTEQASEEARLRASYRGEITYVDALLEELLAVPRMKEAMIAFTADHGENLGEQDRSFDHMLLYPQVVHVPLILAWPEVPAAWRGLRVKRQTQHLGIGRTLLDLAGLVDGEFPGRNLLEAIESDAAEPEAVFAIASDGQCISITRGKDHLILHLGDSPDRDGFPKRRACQVELFDLERDPECSKDLVQEDLELARALRLAIVRWLERTQATGWSQAEDAEPLGAEQIAMLEDLGYAGSAGNSGDLMPDPDCDCEWCARLR